ncbi:hypothetical protein [Thermophilibacter provencensis]|uniref:PH domain-containing protein n=1 Tax=Thermophilibacter provencensis TaxID=1852386 RepID=A0ABT7V5K6_9ACTN|nr:hypothetical protein [Thermophilibacter provencensis]MDM8271874.1 hypothetical protein [Thermophilibacter provencensis]
MDEYNLEPGEITIMQESSVVLLDRSGEERLDEVVLTNKNLVLVNTASQGLFKRTRYLKRCPLDKIASPNGVPQAIASKHRNDYRLQVVFDDETIALRFPANPKRTAERWAEGIRNAALGNLSGIRTEDVLPPEVADLVDGAKGIFGAVFAGGKKQPNTPEATKRPARITKKCVGCHAPLTGRAGETVTCAYCDTKQTL